VKVGDLGSANDTGDDIGPDFCELLDIPRFAESSIWTLVSDCGCARLRSAGDGDLLPELDGEVITLLIGDLLFVTTRDREARFDIFPSCV